MLRLLVVATALVALPQPAQSLPVVPFDPGRQRFTCGGTPAFSRAAMRSAAGAENRTDPAATTLKRFLARQRSVLGVDVLPRGGAWRRLVETPSVVTFGWGTKPGRITRYANVDLLEGGWRIGSFGGCSPRLFASGFEAPPLRLRTLPSIGGHTVHVWLETGSCEPDRAVADVRERLDHVEFARSPSSLRLVVLIRRPDVPICGGVGVEYPFDVRLSDGPVGRVIVRDGGAAPSIRLADLRRGRGRCVACGRL